MEKTFATTAPADCPAHRERPQNAVTSNKLISGIKKSVVKPTGRKGESSFLAVARHTVDIGQRDCSSDAICKYISKAQRVRRFESAGSL